jgi:hypothetical protein
MEGQPATNMDNVLVEHVFSVVESLKYQVPYRAKKWMMYAQNRVGGSEKDYACAADSLSRAAIICFHSGEEFRQSGVILLDSSHRIKKQMGLFPRYYDQDTSSRFDMPKKRHIYWC